MSFRKTPDYERPADSNKDNEYRVTVRASDGRNYGTLDVVVTVSRRERGAGDLGERQDRDQLSGERDIDAVHL